MVFSRAAENWFQGFGQSVETTRGPGTLRSGNPSGAVAEAGQHLRFAVGIAKGVIGFLGVIETTEERMLSKYDVLDDAGNRPCFGREAKRRYGFGNGADSGVEKSAALLEQR